MLSAIAQVARPTCKKQPAATVEIVSTDSSSDDEIEQGDESLLPSTLRDAFAVTAVKYPDHLALVDTHCQRRTTYAQVDAFAASVAAALQERGIIKGDRVAVSLGNTLEGCLAILACYKLGAIAVPLNPAYKHAQAIGALSHITAKCLILSAEANLPFREPISNSPLIESLIEAREVPSVEQVIVVDNSTGEEALPKATNLTLWGEMLENDHQLQETDLYPDDVALIQFTSGTTSAPKGACLTHRNMVESAKATGAKFKYTHRDVVCCPLPLFHIAGTILGLAVCQYYGATLVFPSEAFDAGTTVNALRDMHATAVYAVPTLFVAMLEHTSKNDIPSSNFTTLRTGLIGGSPVHSSFLSKIQSTFHLPDLTVAWGMSETAGVATISNGEDTYEKRRTTAGRPLAHSPVRIVSRQNPQCELPTGERGEVVVGGCSVMKGYWNDTAKTNEVMFQDPWTRETWMRTGDEGMIDADGYLVVTGRIKDIIIRGGENIYPAEIEGILVQHSGIRDASVIGIPDAKYGEIVGAFIIQDEQQALTVAEVRSWVAARLGGTWVPREVFFVTEFPKTPTGKISKEDLRDRAESMLVDRVG